MSFRLREVRAMKFFLFLFVAFFGIAVFLKTAEAQNAAGYEIIKAPDGAARLRITTDFPLEGLWLGVTLYPPKNVAADAVNKVVSIKRGKDSIEIAIDQKAKGGTFEAAVWSQKIAKKDCLPADEPCQKAGYKLAGMKSYIWGYLTEP